MLNTQEFGHLLKQSGFDFYSGVPCSFLKYLINYAINDCNYYGATNEGDAVAICAGAYLGGSKPVFLCQNSGLSNATSPLISLNYPFKIPVLGFVTLRGEKDINDEPQHELMGKITEKFLEDMDIEWQYLADDLNQAQQQIELANKTIQANKPFFFIVKKNTFAEVMLKPQTMAKTSNLLHQAKTREPNKPKRYEALQQLSHLKDQDTLLLATTGYTGRELYTIDDHPNHFYMVGSMGCVSAVGLGLALTKNNKKIVAIDGDGALLMRMGNMATIGYYHPPNLFHLLLDNECHESTGAQATVSSQIDFSQIAASYHYTHCYFVHDLSEFAAVYQAWLKKPVLSFVHLKISTGTLKNLGRPNLTPPQVKQRFMAFCNNLAQQ